MRAFNNKIPLIDLKEKLGQKITRHLTRLERTNKNDKQKILELCQIGKLLATYYPDFEIIKVCEKPDFLISDGQTQIGLEHELILDSNFKEKEGFYQNICEKVEEKLKEDPALPNFLVNLYLKENISLKLQDKKLIAEKLSEIVTHLVLTEELIENDFVDRAIKMNHSAKSINPNFGAYFQNWITEDLVLKFIEKKESKVDVYRHNSVQTQWLVLVIGSNGQSSFEVNQLLKINIKSRFDKIFLYEDFDNQLYELK